MIDAAASTCTQPCARRGSGRSLRLCGMRCASLQFILTVRNFIASARPQRAPEGVVTASRSWACRRMHTRNEKSLSGVIRNDRRGQVGSSTFERPYSNTAIKVLERTSNS